MSEKAITANVILRRKRRWRIGLRTERSQRMIFYYSMRTQWSPACGRAMAKNSAIHKAFMLVALNPTALHAIQFI